jgi:hypothetical protein
MEYPKRIVKEGEANAAIVKALKRQLNAALALKEGDELYLNPANGAFGPKMKRVVKLFQTRNVDPFGAPLKQDGEIGSLSWAALFGTENIPVAPSATNPFLAQVLAVAAAEERKQVREQPKNSNRGPRVEQYLKSVNTPPGYAWCCAFVYWCFNEAAAKGRRSNPMVKTAGCLDHWNRARKQGVPTVGTGAAAADPDLVKPGMVFVMDHGGGAGHTGLVESVTGGLLTTIEGNTDASKTREGGGVYRLNRKIVEINKGFINYGA